MVNVSLADFDETTELSQTRKSHRDRLTRECVEHHIDTFTIGQLHYRLGKIAAPRIDHLLDPERFKEGAFARASCGGDHFRAKVVRDLNRRHSHAARARVNEDAFAFAQSCHVSQRVPRSHKNDRQRRRFLEGKACRNAPHIAGKLFDPDDLLYLGQLG